MRRSPQQRTRWYRARISRCHGFDLRQARGSRLNRYTRPLAVTTSPGVRSDYAVACPLHRDWLLAHSRRLVRLRPPRWSS